MALLVHVAGDKQIAIVFLSGHVEVTSLIEHGNDTRFPLYYSIEYLLYLVHRSLSLSYRGNDRNPVPFLTDFDYIIQD